MERIFFISLGAILGANARYLVSLWAVERLGATFPYGTVIVNISGCFLIGLLNGLVENGLVISPNVRLGLSVGFLGAYTTFSSFGLESINLLRNGSTGASLMNIALSLAGGLVAVVLGLYCARLIQ